MKMILRISQSLSVNLLPEGLTEYFRDILNLFLYVFDKHLNLSKVGKS